MGVKLDRTKKFKILKNASRTAGEITARYEQNGLFFTCGGHLLEDMVKKEPLVKTEPLAEDSFPCPFCEKIYKDEQWLDRHIKSKHTEE